MIHTVDNWLTEIFLAIGPEAEARRAKALPLIAQDETRVPDHISVGQNSRSMRQSDGASSEKRRPERCRHLASAGHRPAGALRSPVGRRGDKCQKRRGREGQTHGYPRKPCQARPSGISAARALSACPASRAWRRPSACHRWEVRDVVGHLILVAELYLSVVSRGLQGNVAPGRLPTGRDCQCGVRLPRSSTR